MPEDVPPEVRANKRYAGLDGFTIAECQAAVARDHGKIDILVHSLANGPEVAKPLLETSRNGYLAALSASSYSKVSMLQRFGPIMNEGGLDELKTKLRRELRRFFNKKPLPLNVDRDAVDRTLLDAMVLLSLIPF